MGDIIVNAKALPFTVGENQAVRIDFDTHADMTTPSKQGIKEMLVHNPEKSAGILKGENDLESTRSALNDNKHHMLIAPHLISGLLTSFDNNAVSFKLEDQTELQQKVSQYFGKDIELECYKHENEYPEYHVENDKIVGEQKIQCSLHPKGFKFEPLFNIDLNLIFDIHPEVDKDGKTLKASFGDIQMTSIAMHDKKLEIETKVSDKMETSAWQLPGLTSELNFPFPFNAEVMKMQQRDSQKLMKFEDIFSTPNIIDKEKLRANLMPAPFKMPLPPGLRFKNPNVKIHENGVIDINGDLDSV
jgi:hypothetical protein